MKRVVEEAEKLSATRPKLPALSVRETKALDFIRCSLGAGTSPSVRQVCQAVGLRSSRSGLRLVNKLISKGYVCRKEDGSLIGCMRFPVAKCAAKRTTQTHIVN